MKMDRGYVKDERLDQLTYNLINDITYLNVLTRNNMNPDHKFCFITKDRPLALFWCQINASTKITGTNTYVSSIVIDATYVPYASPLDMQLASVHANCLSSSFWTAYHEKNQPIYEFI